MRTPTRNRRNQLLELLRRGTVLSVRYLSEQLSVSELTIRRDIDALQAEGIVEHLHGGVQLLQAVAREMDRREISFYVRREVAVEEKRAIAQAALRFISKDQVLFVDDSTTSLYLAQAIPELPLIVVTHSAFLPIELAERTNLQVISTGGIFHPTSLCYLGPASEQVLQQFNTDRAFMGIKGITVTEGCTDANVLDIHLKAIVAQRTRELIILADHSKLGNIGFTAFATISQVRALVTDDKADPALVESYREAGVEVVIAPLMEHPGSL